MPAFDGQPVPSVPLSPSCSPGLASLHHRFPHVASEGARTGLGSVPRKGSTPRAQPFLHSPFCRKISAAASRRIRFAPFTSSLTKGWSRKGPNSSADGRGGLSGTYPTRTCLLWVHRNAHLPCLLPLSAMRKLLLPETVKIVQQNIPSHLPEQLAVTQPNDARAAQQHLFSRGKPWPCSMQEAA